MSNNSFVPEEEWYEFLFLAENAHEDGVSRLFEYPSELATKVATVVKHFAVLHSGLKFEALHILSAILASNYSAPLHKALYSMNYDTWSTFIRVCVVSIL
ncbi:hypothetical protein Vadar_015422 [Vaccinium darrowii]|uniref:Uncharacterized protein n=1 Tax=Vaccinium darrowii TaxID=229202 RepID=A0ACB7Z470_9ERIC|nr:hypothetical protein Vadar_015422 [Vaccinium darrowii]